METDMTKQQMIQRMIELQKQFIEYEQKNGVNPFDYYTPDSGHFLEKFKKEYNELATKVVDAAHGEVGSSRL